MAEFNIHDVDIQAFSEALDRCKGNVYLETEEGDRLNLKSKLSQMMGLFKLIEGAKLVEAKVICDNPDDESMLFRMNLFG